MSEFITRYKEFNEICKNTILAYCNNSGGCTTNLSVNEEDFGKFIYGFRDGEEIKVQLCDDGSVLVGLYETKSKDKYYSFIYKNLDAFKGRHIFDVLQHYHLKDQYIAYVNKRIDTYLEEIVDNFMKSPSVKAVIENCRMVKLTVGDNEEVNEKLMRYGKLQQDNNRGI